MSEDAPVETPSAMTRWSARAVAPVRAFAATESASAGVLVAAVIAAVAWCALWPAAYETVWQTHLSIHLGRYGLSESLQTWINSGLMTLFFLVVGLEARREFDLGDLRERRRFVLPCAAGLAGMVVPAMVYVLVLHGASGADAWAVVVSTDTALALGVLAAVGPAQLSERLRIFLLTVFVVDDIVALLIVTLFYSPDVRLGPLLVAVGALVALVAGKWACRRWLPRPIPLLGPALITVSWVALLVSGVDPIVLGLVVGLASSAYVPATTDLEQASMLFREFREQPTPELARTASAGVARSVSRNLRMQTVLLPWTSYVVVPLFALANAGLDMRGTSLGDALTSPIVIAVVLGYVLGKPIGVVGAAWVVERFSGRRVRPAVGWAAVAGSGTLAGIGFTVSFIVAARALSGVHLTEAKLGVLTAGLLSAAATTLVYMVTARLPKTRRARALLGAADPLNDLYTDVDPEHDHIRGPEDALVTLVEYGDLECPFCGQAEPIVRDLLAEEQLRYVWRHLPLNDVHPHAELAAEATEAAAGAGKFWEMHDELLAHQDELRPAELVAHGERLGLNADKLRAALAQGKYQARVARDVESAELSGVSGTPTFFVNGQRYYGAYDLDSLKQAIGVARERALLRQSESQRQAERTP